MLPKFSNLPTLLNLSNLLSFLSFLLALHSLISLLLFALCSLLFALPLTYPSLFNFAFSILHFEFNNVSLKD